ncbi:MAG: hypothetical protein V1763_02525 [Parcubacteria group bacterium]
MVEKIPQPRPTIEQEEPQPNVTDEAFRRKVDKVVNLFCNSFTVEGADNIPQPQERKEQENFIVVSSHFSNLDAPATIKALGDKLDIQITTESLLHGVTPQEALFRLAGKEHFSTLEYRKLKGGNKTGVFNPADFDALATQITEGKTPWLAIHPFTTTDVMQDARIGAIYLAQKTGAKIIPAGLELQNGGSISFEGLKELARGMKKKTDATYHISTPIALPPLNVTIIETVLTKRARREKVSPEEAAEFRRVHQELKNQADQVADIIAQMLPEAQRGKYSKK